MSAAAQNFKLLGDSLTNKASCTWLACGKVPFKEGVAACLNQKEYTFYANKKGVRAQCINGEWVKNNFTWIMGEANRDYNLQVINEKGVDDYFSIQLIGDITVQTRLTFKDYSRKDFTRFCKK
jgi:hypothetical protein